MGLVAQSTGEDAAKRYEEPLQRNQVLGDCDTLDLGSTRRAVFVTAMTTMIGFGSLLTASHRGLASLGLLMLLGSAAGLVAALVVLPALLAWRHELS